MGISMMAGSAGRCQQKAKLGKNEGDRSAAERNDRFSEIFEN